MSDVATMCGIKWGIRGSGILDSEGSHRQRRPQTYAVLSRNCICRDLRAFSGVIFPSFDRNSNIFAIFIEQKSYGQNRKAFDRTENLSIEQKSYRQTFLSRKRAITTFLSRKFMITRSSIAFEDFLGSSIAPQVMPPWPTLQGSWGLGGRVSSHSCAKEFCFTLFILQVSHLAIANKKNGGKHKRILLFSQ